MDSLDNSEWDIDQMVGFHWGSSQDYFQDTMGCLDRLDSLDHQTVVYGQDWESDSKAKHIQMAVDTNHSQKEDIDCSLFGSSFVPFSHVNP